MEVSCLRLETILSSSHTLILSNSHLVVEGGLGGVLYIVSCLLDRLVEATLLLTDKATLGVGLTALAHDLGEGGEGEMKGLEGFPPSLKFTRSECLMFNGFYVVKVFYNVFL